MSRVFGSVSSGIEAASVAWEPLGWECRFVAEIDPKPSAVLAHHYPGVPNLGDFTRIGADAGPINLLVGGPPCQSNSVAGRRAGMADDRGKLALEFLRLAGRLRPDWVVFENVPGLLSVNRGRDFGAFLGLLAELGYGFAYRVLDAQFVRVDGFGRAVPQRRRRVFVVGHLGNWRRAAAVLFERESLCGNSPPRREAGQDVAPTISARTQGGGGFGTDFDCDGGLIPEVSLSLSGSQQRFDGTVETLVAHSLRADGFDASEDGTGRGTPIVPVLSHGACGSNGLGIGREVDPSFTLDTTNAMAVAFQERGRDGGRSLEWQEDIAYSLNAPSGGGRRQELNIFHRWTVRRLTPREAERLQGFPDDYTLVQYRGKTMADGPRYKMVGNSMAVNVMRWLGRRIDMVES